MTKKLRLLNIEDCDDDSLLLQHHLSRAGYELVFKRVDTEEELVAALNSHPWDLIISDYVMPHFSALTALALVKKCGLDIPFLILSGAIGEETAVAAMRAGASDYLMKNNLARLIPAIERELQEVNNRRERTRTEVALRNAEKLATLGRLAATIAHEVNNPLEAVTNLLYLLSHRKLDPASREYLRMADQELARVSHIVKQTLGFTRSNSNPEPVSVPALLDEIVHMYAPKIEAAKVVVQKHFEFAEEITAVAGELRQVFSNLIVNAVEAVGDGGRVRLHVFRCRDWQRPERHGIRVVIGDDGVGIRPEHRKGVFQAFFSTKAAKGTGLGLWVSSEIVQKHGGRIKLRSSVRPGRSGTVFSVFLPIAATPVKARSATASA